MNKIVYVGLLRGWFVVRGPHHTPISGRFDSKAEAEAWLKRRIATIEMLQPSADCVD